MPRLLRADTAKPGSKKPGRKGLKKCKGCRKQFSVRVGTIFEESKIPLCKWLMAIHLMTASKPQTLGLRWRFCIRQVRWSESK